MNSEDTNRVTIAGIMTGNSLDAVDVAIFHGWYRGERVTKFTQLVFHSQPCSPELRAQVLRLRAGLRDSNGKVTGELEELLQATHDRYHDEVNRAVTAARAELRGSHHTEIDVIGFHGQTLAHTPPSVAKGGQRPYTIQLVNGGCVADTQGVVTVADFRSDDLLNGGEGAPFAPGFNALLTSTLNVKRAIFINAGNTSNIAIINAETGGVRGWDCGPCNQFSDLLMRDERGCDVDLDGAVALSGSVVPQLIEALWNTAVTRQDGSNALEIVGPRSFDPQWYRLTAECGGPAYAFEDRLRSVVAFSAYCVAHSMAIATREGFSPEIILLFGGGWKNPVLGSELRDLCSGKARYVLPQHRDLFSNLARTIRDPGSLIRSSDDVGLPSNGMEAGIFAFAALQRLLGQPFTSPSFTNCRAPTVCGAIFVPKSGALSTAVPEFSPTDERNRARDPRLSRAAPSNQ